VAATQSGQVESGRLVKPCGVMESKRRQFVFAHEEGVRPGEVAGDQSILEFQPFNPRGE